MKYSFLKFVLLLVLLAIIQIVSAQVSSKDITLYDTTFVSNYKIDCSFNDILSSEYNDTIYYIDNNQKPKNKETLTIIGFSERTDSFFEKNVICPKNDKYLTNLSRFPIRGFWLKNDTLYLLIYKSIYKFVRDRYNIDNYYFTFKVDLELSYYNRAFLINDGIVLLYKKESRSNNLIFLYDFEKDIIICKKSLDNPVSLLSIFAPRDVICVNKQYIYYSPANDYIVRIYDKSLDLVDSIIYDKKGWKSFPIERSKNIIKKYDQDIDIINEISDEVRGKYSSMTRIFATDNRLILMYFMVVKGNGNYYYDVWRKDNGIWQLEREGVSDFTKEQSKNKNRLLPFYSLIFNDSIVYRLMQGTPLQRRDYNTDEEYYNEVEKYQIEHDCLLSIDKLIIQ